MSLCAWLYVASILGLWYYLSEESDRSWAATVLMFGPLWLGLAPLVILVPAAAFLRRRTLIVLLIGLILLVGPVMDFSVPWTTWQSQAPSSFRVRVLTCNVHRKSIDAEALRTFLIEVEPDVVALQDCLPGQEANILPSPANWHVRRNEVLCLASRFPIREFDALDAPPFTIYKGDILRHVLETPTGRLDFFNLHLDTPRHGLVAVRQAGLKGAAEMQANTELRREQTVAATRWINQSTGPYLIAGDFNTPPVSTIYRDHWSGYTNAFSQAGLGWGHTYFIEWTGVRIDHILAGPYWRCGRCWVGPDVGSEHRPLVADMEWLGK